MRNPSKAVVACIIAGGLAASAARGQDAGPPPPQVDFARPTDVGPPVGMPPPAALPPLSDRPVPGAAPAVLAAPPALATPGELVDKSVRDLQEGRLGAAARDDIKALRRGPLLIHNYCGIGNRPGTSPIDALDAACQRHDSCTHTGKLPSCRCDDLLRIETSEIAQDPAMSPDIRALAAATAASMLVLVCK